MRILLGVSGGIAAYKAAQLTRELVRAGHDVHVVPTPSALRFVGVPTWEALSRNPVTADIFDDVAEVRHVALGQQADLILIAPATANTLAKLAAGLADDLLGTSVLASTAPVVVAPAMHTEMWEHPATQANVQTLRGRGVHFVGPVSGALTGPDSGPGRMAEPEDIAREALACAASGSAELSWLAGKRVVISAGGTREPIDPVRFISNRSTGSMGVALARVAAAAGADVTLVAANLEVPAPLGVDVVPIETALELREQMLQREDADLTIMAAAVADYRVDGAGEQKLKKEQLGDQPVLHLTENPDILKELAGRPHPGLLVGFAAETAEGEELLELGRKKLERKGCDALVVNRVGSDAGFGAVDTAVTVLARGGAVLGEAAGDKMSVARGILAALDPAN